MKKIIYKYFFYSILIFIIFLIFIVINIKNENSNYLSKINLNLKLPKKISKNECNITYLSNSIYFTNIKQMKKINTMNKNTTNKLSSLKKIFIRKNIIIINNKKFYYLGDIKKDKLYAIFKTFENNLTKYFEVTINQKLSNLTLKENNDKYLLFKDNNNTTYILKKNFIDIKQYQKDKNETKK